MFQYHRPASLPEACRLLRELGSSAIPLAGGTDVLVDLHRGSRRPDHLVSLGGISELTGIGVRDGVLRIGALSTPALLEASETVRLHRPELLDAVRIFGTPQVRHRATLGGNLCTASSCGDLPPLLLALGAQVSLAGPDGRREIPLSAFFSHHRKTTLGPGEILVEVLVPPRSPGEGAAYEAFGQRAANFITVASVAAWIRIREKACTEARIALGAVSPTPLLVPEAGAALIGSRLEEEDLREAARAARVAAAPITDVRGSAEHRRELTAAMCIRALRRARERAAEGEGATR